MAPAQKFNTGEENKFYLCSPEKEVSFFLFAVLGSKPWVTPPGLESADFNEWLHDKGNVRSALSC